MDIGQIWITGHFQPFLLDYYNKSKVEGEAAGAIVNKIGWVLGGSLKSTT